LKKRATRLEREHLALIASLPCAVCGNSPVHVHHLPTQGGKRNHFRTIPMCPYHHMDGPYSESIHQGRKAFEANFGTTEDELFAKTNQELGL
jgi:hypothetical protein